MTLAGRLAGPPGGGIEATGVARPEDLVARSEPVGPAGAGSVERDLLAVAGDRGFLFQREGGGLAGRGVALRLNLPAGLAEPGAGAAVCATLGAIGRRGDAGPGPVALGALPFSPEQPAMLVVPALTVSRGGDGRLWRTTVQPSAGLGRGAPGPALAAVLEPRWPPDGFSLRSPVGHEAWCDRVARAVEAVRGGRLEKVVLAREVVVEANRPLLTGDILARLRALYPSCTTFSVDGFIGASPELLVSRRGRHVASRPLAGTVARSGDPDADAALAGGLLGSAKEVHEHRVVVDAVADALSPLCTRLDVPPSPEIVPLRNVSHMGTLVQGELAGPSPPTALELAARLHPTPAVAGWPRDVSLAVIGELEGLDRDRYAGPVGWVDSRGDGEWVIGIRSATLAGRTARLLAGGGIVADSDPRSELTETQLKLQALLAAVVRP